MAEDTAPAVTGSGPASSRRKVGPVVVAVIVLIAGGFFVRNALWSRNHESTDNAQIASDVVLVSPLVSGTVAELLVQENEAVKRGQPLIRLDKDKLQAAVELARANVKAAEADAVAAGAGVAYAAASSQASQATASGGLGEAGADIGAARSAARAAEATVKGLQARSAAAQSDVQAAEIDRKVAVEALARAEAALESAKAESRWAVSAVSQAEAALNTALAEGQLAQRQLKRVRALFEQGAESRQALDNAEAFATTAEQHVVSMRSNRSMATATVGSKDAALKSAQAAIAAARSGVDQAQIRIGTARQKADSVLEDVNVARFQASATGSRLQTAMAHAETAKGQAQASQALDLNVDKMRADQRQAAAKVEQARAALRAAEIDLEHATVYAPADGRVSRRSIEVGSSVQVGTPLLYIVPSEAPFVVANFKESQVGRMKEGDKVEIEVDALPGAKFEGRVASLSPATGATFALLPPDNSTGNFVKVVQRIPVRIELSPSTGAEGRLRVGMSVVATVEVR
ncbi:MAG: HlyD family secretion protein [Armatimonadetes bacterium]|nr:HlyD family secretion protein [Armatimonadota bacterium]